MERFTFADPTVQAKLSGFKLLQADVTTNSEDDKALLAKFSLFGPPGIIFYDAGGQEMKSVRIVGFQDTAQFLKTLQQLGNNS
jgi:thiol:disulfide interchange protein DsbD